MQNYKTFISLYVQVIHKPQSKQSLDDKKMSNVDQKEKMKEAVMCELKLTNRFDCLQDKLTAKSTGLDYDGPLFDKMFTVGTRNIFNLRRKRIFLKLRKTNICTDLRIDPSSNIDESPLKKKNANSLNCFHTLNRFELLCDNPEDDIEKVIKRSCIVIANKKSLNKCRRCNFKKRQCILNPGFCTAIDKICAHCKKVGHFPSSLCCLKRRKTQEKKNVKMIKPKSSQQVISKKNMKLINSRIKQLDFQSRRESIINLADKCAKKYENGTFNKEPQAMLNYCSRKLNKLLKIKSYPDSKIKDAMQKILNV